jgi:tRNA(Arg) A34 adenosine deaminase TadA
MEWGWKEIKLECEKKFMKLAIEKAKEGILIGQTPFGACIVKDRDIISCAHNVVWNTTDITAHAEVHAIRLACDKLKTIDLSGCHIYSTCEPCPMCFSAIHWAGINTIFYGASIEDAKVSGFNELSISNQEMKASGGSPIEIFKCILKEDCCKLFEVWLENKGRAY